jgi:hypothetical protein
LSRRSLYAVANNHRVAVTASGRWAWFWQHFESVCGNVERRLLSEGSADEWERARREIPKSARRRTANSAERTLTAVMAVLPGLREKLEGSFGSNGSAPTQRISEKEDVWEAYEERAAIMEFDGGLSRDEAEREAWALVSKRYWEH